MANKRIFAIIRAVLIYLSKMMSRRTEQKTLIIELDEYAKTCYHCRSIY